MAEFARVISYKLKPGTADELRNLIEQSVVPWLKGRDGFHGLHMVQLSDAEAFAFETWETKQQADAAKGEEERLIEQTVGHIMATPPSYSEGKMIVHAPAHEPHHAGIHRTA